MGSPIGNGESVSGTYSNWLLQNRLLPSRRGLSGERGRADELTVFIPQVADVRTRIGFAAFVEADGGDAARRRDIEPHPDLNCSPVSAKGCLRNGGCTEERLRGLRVGTGRRPLSESQRPGQAQQGDEAHDEPVTALA